MSKYFQDLQQPAKAGFVEILKLIGLEEKMIPTVNQIFTLYGEYQ